MFPSDVKNAEWQLLTTLGRAHRGLAAAWWALILARGLLPAGFVVLVGLLVEAVRRGDPLGLPLLGLGAVFIVMQLLAPLHAQVGNNLGSWTSSWLHDQLLAGATAPAGMAHLESSELAGELTMARDFDLGMAAPPMHLSMGIIAGGLVEFTIGLAQVAVLTAYHWWAAALVGGAWLATHWLLRDSTFWDRNTGAAHEAQRRAEYAYRLGVDGPAAKEVRLFGLGDWTVAQFAQHRRRLVELRWRAMRLRGRPVWLTVAVLIGANATLFWALARDAAAGAVGIGEVMVFAQAAIGASALAFGGLSWALPLAADGVAAVLRLPRAMATAGGLPDGDRDAAGLPRAEVRFRAVGFTYPGGSQPVLDGLDLTIPAGGSLAIVGLNGAGKTTLVKLLCRLYDPTSGAIEVDGTDLRRLALASWRRRIAAVFQDFVRYELPLRDNVAPLGAPDDRIRAALATAGAADLAGLDTVLARGYDGSTELSGGQWQRVALARALCAVRQGAGLVILDEPTAQLDVRGESEVFDRVLAATRGCTTVLISHRFASVRHADRICVLEHGRVAELGTHDELMDAGGRYRRLFDLQASRFEEHRHD